MKCPLCNEALLEYSARENAFRCLSVNCRFHTPNILNHELKNLIEERKEAAHVVKMHDLRIEQTLAFIAKNLFKNDAPVWYED